MFSGIITDVGRVRRLSRGPGTEGGLEATIATAYESAAIPLGASIACSGPCLTVVAVEPGAFSVQASAETLACSTLGDWVRFVIEAPAVLMPFIASKGSVALDGVSLTVNEVAGGNFGVNIIPYTL